VTVDVSATGRAVFLAALYEGCDGLLEFRAFNGTKRAPPVGWQFYMPADYHGIDRFVTAHRSHHVYVAIATRRTATSGKLENCLHLGAVFADIDFKAISEAEARARLARFVLPPSPIVFSGGGLHAYWLLREPIDLRDATARAEAYSLLRRLASALHADRIAAEPAHVLRVPGTYNHKPKYGSPRAVVVELLEPDRRYNPSELDAVLPPEPARTDGETFTLPERILEGSRNDTLWRYGRSLKAQGRKLPRILAALQTANRERCEPPLPDDELEAVAHNVMTEANRSTFGAARTGRQHARALADEQAGDMWLARLFVTDHHPHLRYVKAWRKWLVWTGTHWALDETGEPERRALATIKGLYASAAAADDAERKRLATLAVKADKRRRVEDILALAGIQPELVVRPGQLDADPWVLNCLNGVLDLKTGELHPHRRDDLLTKVTAVPYQPDAQHPVWNAFLPRVLPDPETRAYAQRWVGYCLTGSTEEDKYTAVHGPTKSGKTTFNEAVRKMLGDYAKVADISAFAVRRHHHAPREDIARLHGARLVVAYEVPKGLTVAEGLLKSVTGGDPLAARRLYQETFEYVPQFKLVTVGNVRARLPDDDEAVWTRVNELPFPLTIPKAVRDPKIKKILTDPTQAGAAILAWAVQGLAAWRRDGLGTAKAIEHATADYRAAMSPLADFLAERCVLDPEKWVASATLWQQYQAWATNSHVTAPLTRRAFAERLKVLGMRPDRAEGRDQTRIWRGVGLRADAADASDTTVHNSSRARAGEEVPDNGGDASAASADPSDSPQEILL
jgi:putative DNA primase/helicase